MNYSLAFRLALREMRGGLRGFAVFLACIALGVAAIAGVGSVSRGMTEGLEREGRAILGGDLAFELVQRQATAGERAFLDGNGAVSEIATLRAMARTSDGAGQTLVELKAVDSAYPLFGTVALDGGGSLEDALGSEGAVFGGVADPDLLARLDAAIGDLVEVGNARIRLAGIIENEPDRLAGGFSFGPRLMVSEDALKAAELVQPGSLVTWTYRLQLGDGMGGDGIAAVADRAAEEFPNAGWQIRSHEDAAPRLRRNIERFAVFLTLIGLTTLIVGGVGVGNAISSYLDGKRHVIATLKCLSAPASLVVFIYLLQTLILAALGISIGLLIGAGIPFIADSALSTVLPVSIRGIYPTELGIAALYGVATALAFSLLPLGRTRDVRAIVLFREMMTPPGSLSRPFYLIATATAFAVLATAAIATAQDRRIAVIFAISLAASFMLLRIVASAIMWLARHAPQVRSTELRLALGNIHRPGTLTPSIVLALGLGLTLIVAVVLVDGNFRRDLVGSIPHNAPSFFFLDLPSEETDRFRAFIDEEAKGAELEPVPMLRGRITRVAGVPSGEVEANPNIRWALDGDRGVTFMSTIPDSAILTEGTWWSSDYSGPPLVSMELEVAQGLGLKLGDSITVNVRGREISATVANFRAVEWQSLSINFVMVFSPNTFAGAPYSNIATLTFPDGGTLEEELLLLRRVTDNFPAVTVVRIKEAIETANRLLEQLGWAVSAVSAVTLSASALVLGGAFAASRRQRIHDAVVLKMLGATRARLLTAFGLEFLMVGLATAGFGLLAGIVAAWFILSTIMEIEFAFLAAPALTAAAATLVLTACLGLASTLRALGQKPAPVLRNL